MKRTVNITISAFIRATVWMLLIVFTLASCTKDKDEFIEQSRTGKVTLTPTIAGSVENVISTRGIVNVNTDKQGVTYDDAIIADRTEIMAYAVPTDPNAQSKENRTYGTFRYRIGTNDVGKWTSHITASPGLDYNLYAISPSTLPGAINQEFNWGLTGVAPNQTFNINDVAITFTGLDVITTVDPMVCIAADGKHTRRIQTSENPVTYVEKLVVLDNEDPDQATYADIPAPSLTKGNFSIGTTVIPGDNDTENYYRVWLAMDHLYSKISISLSVDPDYNAIRHIRLNKAWLIIEENTFTGDHKYSFKDGFIPANGADFDGDQVKIKLMKATDQSTDPGPESHIYDIRDKVDNEGLPYITLTTDPQELAWLCLLPKTYLPEDKQYPSAKLKVEYDVVCQGQDGKWTTVVRKDQTAENKFPLDAFRVDAVELPPTQGTHFNVKVLVKPTYLYQLADDDAKLELSIE